MDKLEILAVAVAAPLWALQVAQAQEVQFDISGFVVEGNTLLPADHIQSTLSAFTGTGRGMEDVKKAADALRTLYQGAGYSVVQVVPPQQTIASGQVLLKVLEDRVTSINVAGNQAYDADNIRASLPALQLDKSLNVKALDADITLANENAAKQVAINVKPGVKPGDIDTTINVTEDRISKWVASYDNTGTSTTGINKIGLTYQNANLFNRDHSLALQYNGTTENFDKVYSFSAGYHVPFYQQGLSADFIAAYSSSSGQNVNLYFAGQGTVLGARLNYALGTLGDIRQKLIIGVDYKKSESVQGPLTTPISEIPLSLGYVAQVTRPEFQGSTALTWLTNLGGGHHGAEADYYDKVKGTGARLPLAGPASNNFPGTNWQAFRLNGNAGFGLSQGWQARVAVNAQFSNDLLLPSEQFGAGGATTVRGYPERIIAGDKGHTFTLELYTPELATTLNLPDASLRALLFWDRGEVSVNDNPIPAGFNKTSSIESIGLGLRMSYKKDVTVKFDIGWAQKAAGQLPTLVNPGETYSVVALTYTF